ncbi:NlpC/P60 family protein [Shewanella colwelliana]|uniref:NlpC/P60 family protein n=1 Tax=Shewanella colwelliana TaxID=23 RepID=UPI0022AEA632|nr:NlpC/P60 family protein [Shewanella colwelliana]MCZ4339293.1 NlpC/P60 family protein [Shewanella colwelliana]
MRLFFLALVLILSGCSSSPSSVATTNAKSDSVAPLPVPSSQLEAKLMNFYLQWQGTRYRLGGMSQHGVDCSGLVVLAYRDMLALQLPRTTEEQAQLGKKISKVNLRTGDLVLFKTGWSTRHVGIYLSDSRFLHASTSQGVMISRLDNRYWQQKYWQSRRISPQ